MKIVQAYPLKRERVQELLLPRGAVLLSCVLQGNRLILFAFVEAEEKETYKVTIGNVGTGEEIPPRVKQFFETVYEEVGDG